MLGLADIIQTPVLDPKTGVWIIAAKPIEEVLSALNLHLGTSVSERPAEINNYKTIINMIPLFNNPLSLPKNMFL